MRSATNPIEFGVKIATYCRPNGKTPEQLKATLRSVVAQTYARWRIFLVGDKYEPIDEWDALVAWAKETCGPERIVAFNLNRAIEREVYTARPLWCTGGLTAINAAIEAMHEYGVRYTAHLDDDDLWYVNHLELLARAIVDYPEAVFWFTKGVMGHHVLPPEDVELGYDNRPPQGDWVYHSTLAWDLHRMPLRYRNLMLFGIERPADADLLNRVASFCEINGLHTVHIPEVTVRHT